MGIESAIDTVSGNIRDFMSSLLEEAYLRKRKEHDERKIPYYVARMGPIIGGTENGKPIIVQIPASSHDLILQHHADKVLGVDTPAIEERYVSMAQLITMHAAPSTLMTLLSQEKPLDVLADEILTSTGFYHSTEEMRGIAKETITRMKKFGETYGFPSNTGYFMDHHVRDVLGLRPFDPEILEAFKPAPQIKSRI